MRSMTPARSEPTAAPGEAMVPNAPLTSPWPPRHEGLRIGGEIVRHDRVLEVRNPATGELAGTVAMATAGDVHRACELAAEHRSRLTRQQRYSILMSARELIDQHREQWARLITTESGLCLKDTFHEVGRTCDVLLAAAHQVLLDDGQVFAGDVTAGAKPRRVFTMREPLLGVIAAITPFNHPLNQVAHKVAPAVATNNRVVLKPSEKTPLTALAFADTLVEAGLPPEMVQVVVGEPAEICAQLLGDSRVELLSFTGSTHVGKLIAAQSGYRRIVLELGGIDPAIVLDDADLAEAARLAAQGAYRNSGQRCTAVKRILVHERVAEEFVCLLLQETRQLTCGDPLDPATDVGTVIDRSAAQRIAATVDDAVRMGAAVLHGGVPAGAYYPPTVVDLVRPEMPLVNEEVFGPVSPVIRFAEDDQAIQIANSIRYALSAAVFTRSLDRALRFITDLHAGTVNVGEVPGHRLEFTPFGGIKDSGLGYKEGVIETMKAYTNVRTYSLPWPVAR